MIDWLRFTFAGRPWWMNAMMVFCAFMAFVYVPWDLLLKPVAEDEEVWFGVVFSGWDAKAVTPFHWAVYAAGAYGFRHMRRWMWPWAAAYVGQIAFSMLVWNAVYVGGFSGWASGVVSALVFTGIAATLWKARPLFAPEVGSLRERYGEWALVTGASAGIGAEFARALAHEGVSCILTARREDRLRELASELEKRHQVATRIVAADLSAPSGVDSLAGAVSDLEIGMLIANAGAGYAGRFEKQDAEQLRAMIELNCVAPVVLTSRILPGMRRRGRGAIIVTGSVAGRQALPLHGVYSATKAFDLMFGESLSIELRGTGIDVIVLEPGPTETEFQEVAGEVAHPRGPAERVVRVALDALGRQPSVIPGWLDWLRANAGSRLLPRPLVAHLAGEIMAARVPEAMR